MSLGNLPKGHVGLEPAQSDSRIYVPIHHALLCAIVPRLSTVPAFQGAIMGPCLVPKAQVILLHNFQMMTRSLT